MVADPGQAHTLESFTAALLLIGGVIFALQVTAVTPLTASTSSQHVENQQLQVARGMLDSAVQNESLRHTLLFWNETRGSFLNSSDEGYYSSGGPPTTFGHMLNRTFRDRGIAMNVNIHYITKTGDIRVRQMVHFGAPSDHAVAARRTMTLFDDDTMTGSTSDPLNDSNTYFAHDISPTTGLYHVVRVEVLVWRM